MFYDTLVSLWLVAMASYWAEFLIPLRDFGIKEGWHLKYAKFNREAHQSLLSHCLNVASVSSSILDYLIEIKAINGAEKLRMQTLLTGFLHDAGKATAQYQTAVVKFLNDEGPEPLNFGHQKDEDIRPVVERLKTLLKWPLADHYPGMWDEVIWSVTNLGKQEDAGGISRSFKKAPSIVLPAITEIVHLADVMASSRSVDKCADVRRTGTIMSKLFLTFSKVSSVRGILTQFLHKALEDQFVEAGWRPIQWFPNGTVYMSNIEKAPVISHERIIQSVRDNIERTLSEYSLRLAKSSFGSLPATVIAAPEFLFLSEKTIDAFWQFVSSQRFAAPNIKNQDEMDDKKADFFKAFCGILRSDDSTNRTYFARFNADYNLLIVLFAIQKALVEAAPAKEYDAILQLTNNLINRKLISSLDIDGKSLEKWPKIANQTSITARLQVAESLISSPIYADYDRWRKKVLEAFKNCTYELKKIWDKHVPNKYQIIAEILVADIASPLETSTLQRMVEDLTTCIEKGKLRKGTPICECCGGVAQVAAQAELFGNSQIYHDHLVAGSRLGTSNKINACILCDFEAKLRHLLTDRGDVYYVLPQSTLSRDEHARWQKILNSLAYDIGKFPNINSVERWAQIVWSEDLEEISRATHPTDFRRLEKAIDNVAKRYGFIDLSIMTEPPVDSKSGEDVVKAINEDKCRINQLYIREVNEEITNAVPMYISPNYLMMMTRRSIDSEVKEPQSSIAIRKLFIRCLLSRIFSATVLDENDLGQGKYVGYTTTPSQSSLRAMSEKFNGQNGWIKITELDKTLKWLSALFLISVQLSRLKVDYGRSTILRILEEQPGKLLVRINNQGARWSGDLLKYLDLIYKTTFRGE